MYFGGMKLTTKGKNLQIKVQAGEQLQYTRIAVGDGDIGSSSFLELNVLKHEVLSLNIQKLKIVTENEVLLSTVLSNSGLSSGFYFRELGVFAQDPIEGEILYCYAHSITDPEYIPAEGGADVLERNLNFRLSVSNASNVSAIINSSLVYATKTELDALDSKVDSIEVTLKNITDDLLTKVDKVEGKQLSTENYTTEEKNKLAGIDKNANNYVHPNDSNTRHVTDQEKEKWNGYGSELAEITQQSDDNKTDIENINNTKLPKKQDHDKLLDDIGDNYFKQSNYGNIKNYGTHTLILSDANCYIRTDGNITIPNNSSVSFPIGTQITIINKGASSVNIIPSSGVSIYSKGSKRTLKEQFATATLIKYDTNWWDLIGDLS